MIESSRRIVEAILSIPRGRVSSYRDVARIAGLPNGARQVVRILHTLSRPLDLPWYRVIRANGCIALLAGEGRELQTALLRAEGVEVSERGWVDLETYGFIR
jgi:methylated-DNA-protein-cysteine methyltransferase-like protein